MYSYLYAICSEQHACFIHVLLFCVWQEVGNHVPLFRHDGVTEAFILSVWQEVVPSQFLWSLSMCRWLAQFVCLILLFVYVTATLLTVKTWARGCEATHRAQSHRWERDHDRDQYQDQNQDRWVRQSVYTHTHTHVSVQNLKRPWSHDLSLGLIIDSVFYGFWSVLISWLTQGLPKTFTEQNHVKPNLYLNCRWTQTDRSESLTWTNWWSVAVSVLRVI